MMCIVHVVQPTINIHKMNSGKNRKFLLQLSRTIIPINLNYSCIIRTTEATLVIQPMKRCCSFPIAVVAQDVLQIKHSCHGSIVQKIMQREREKRDSHDTHLYILRGAPPMPLKHRAFQSKPGGRGLSVNRKSSIYHTHTYIVHTNCGLHQCLHSPSQFYINQREHMALTRIQFYFYVR